jgi:hypothetical protein
MDNIEYDSKRNVYYAGGFGRLYEVNSYIMNFRSTGVRSENNTVKSVINELDASTLEVKLLLSQYDAINLCTSGFLVSQDILLIGSWVDKSI